MRGDGRVYKRGQNFWVAYFLDGREFREAAKTRDGKTTSDAREAEKFLRAKMKKVHAAEIGALPFVTPQSSRLTIGDLLEALKTSLKIDGKLSGQTASHLKRAIADLGDERAATLTSLDDYIARRKNDGAANATINRVTQLVSQAYRLAIEHKRLSQVPSIRHLSEKGNARQGFFSEAEFYAVHSHLPEDLKDFALYCYVTGSRKGEAAQLRWNMLQARALHVPAEITKNGEARTIPLGVQVAEIIERRKAARQVEVNGTIQMVEYIFHREGRPVGEFRKSWKTACKSAGCPGKLFHDLRRSCARRLIMAGCSQQQAKKVTGHKSNSQFERYAILVDDDVLAAQQKFAEYHEPTEQKIVAMGK